MPREGSLSTSIQPHFCSCWRLTMIIKICGLSTRENIDWVVDAGAEWIGFASFPPSPRHVELSRMAELAEYARGRTKIAVLSVDPDDALLDAIMATASPDILQLHGKETPQRVAEVRARYEVPVMKVLGVSTAEDVARARLYDEVTDYFLFDAKPPKDATRPGGLGVTFDWDLLQGLDLAKPFMLSGGLRPTNVAEAINRVRPFGLDVSSGVESAPGVKDEALVRAFIANARAAQKLYSLAD